MNRNWKVLNVAIAIVATLVLVAGCGGAEEGRAEADAPADAAAEPAAEAVVLEISPEAAEILAEADRADGTEDHVVEQCATCNLAMDGKPENSLQVGEYEMHFCSDTCKRSFQDNAEESILNLPTS